MALRFWKADVFAAGQAAGNPAACICPQGEGESLSAGQMQAIARELAGYAHEVCFSEPTDGGLGLHSFTPAGELAACGYSALTVLTALASELPGDRVKLLAPGGESFARRLPDGLWAVAALPTVQGKLPMHEDDVCRALVFDNLYLDGGCGLALRTGAMRTLLVPIRTAEALTDIQPDVERLTDLAAKYALDYVLLYTGDRVLPAAHYRTRVFAPKLGYWEDQASGPANAALGESLLERGAWRGGTLTVEQGRSYRSPALVSLAAEGEGAARRVLFSGSARVRVVGEYLPCNI